MAATGPGEAWAECEPVQGSDSARSFQKSDPNNGADSREAVMHAVSSAYFPGDNRATSISLAETVSLDVRRLLFHLHGNFALAYSATFQPGLEHFGDEGGFITYKTIGSTALVLSNPIAPDGNCAALLERFIREKGDCCFWQISRPIAEILAAFGFSVNEMGTESRIDLSGYEFDGPAKRSFRRARNRMARHEYTTCERSVASLNRRELAAVSEKWRSTRRVKNREMTFLVRPVVLDDEADVRKFFTFDRNGNLKAFAFFDPIYEAREVVGYLCSSRRRLPDADSLVGYAQMAQAIELFQKEGKRFLSLGCSPFANIKDREFPRYWLVQRSFRVIYRNPLFNRFLYPFQRLAKHKGAFGGTAAQTYYAFNRLPALPRLFKVLRACSLI